MLQPFFEIHDFLVGQAHMPIRRRLMDEIDWSHRLIAIRGGRGVGKTDFLLFRAKEIEQQNAQSTLIVPKKRRDDEPHRPVLYVNLNSFFFTQHTLVEFVSTYVKAGGQYLFLDQVFLYPNWSKELRRCHDRFKDLHIVFCASPVMSLEEDNRDLNRVVKVYNLRGFSFREFLCLRTGLKLEPLSLQDILHSHASFSIRLCERIDPLPYFHEYLRHGYYPSFLENKNFEEDLIKTLNAILTVDIAIIKQIEIQNLHKMRTLLNVMLEQNPGPLNVSSLSETIKVSRSTTMNYIKYLKDARLVNLLYMEGKSFPMKPFRVFMQNTNIAYLSVNKPTMHDIYETYFYNALHDRYKINATERNAQFIVDNKYYFDVVDQRSPRDHVRPCVIGDLQRGRGNYIPLWMLGFLY